MTVFNGELFNTVVRILEDEQEIPDNVRNNMLMAAIKHNFRYVKEVSGQVTDLAGRVDTIEKARGNEAVISERNVTWPWIKDNIIVPIIRTAITLALGYVFFKISGIAP